MPLSYSLVPDRVSQPDGGLAGSLGTWLNRCRRRRQARSTRETLQSLEALAHCGTLTQFHSLLRRSRHAVALPGPRLR